MPNISKKKLETVNLIKPPLKLQEKSIEIVEFVEAQKTRLQAHLTEANTLFASLHMLTRLPPNIRGTRRFFFVILSLYFK